MTDRTWSTILVTCDRCGASAAGETEDRNNATSFFAILSARWRYGVPVIGQGVNGNDLCKDCARSLIKWFQEGKR